MINNMPTLSFKQAASLRRFGRRSLHNLLAFCSLLPQLKYQSQIYSLLPVLRAMPTIQVIFLLRYLFFKSFFFCDTCFPDAP